MKFKYLLIIILASMKSMGQVPTVGLIQHSYGSLDDGYVLFAPIISTTTYLIDKCGHKVHSWSSDYQPGQSVYLLEDGELLRSGIISNNIFYAGGHGGNIEKLDWNSNVMWSYQVSDSFKCQHHDIKPMPNGNILVIAWEKKTIDEAVANGRNPALLGPSLWSEQILELKPVGTDSAIIVWEWHLWDHLIQRFDSTKLNYGRVVNHPELINLNFRGTTDEDWIHMNAVDYNPELDQIMISAHNFNEIWVIDHSTSTAEAASHSGGIQGKGGDILWRWGNPFAYTHGTIQDKKLFMQHNPHWIPAGLPHEGDIMVFNNGNLRNPVEYSSVDIIAPPVNPSGSYSPLLPCPPDSAFWVYKDSIPENFYSKNISGAQQLSNGNVLICNGFYGSFFEIDSNKKIVWRYVNPVASYIYSQGDTNLVQNNVFRCTFYPSDYSGFVGKTLVPGLPIEQNPYFDTCTYFSKTSEIMNSAKLQIFPNPATDRLSIDIPAKYIANYEITIYNIFGEQITNFNTSKSPIEFDISDLSPGLHFIKIKADRKLFTSKFIIIR